MQAIGKKSERTHTRHKTFFSVLLIDDDVDILRLFKRSLEQVGRMHTFAFTNSMLAVEHFRRNANSYDIVVTDIQMPYMSGFRVAKAVKQIRPDIKVAFATSFDIKKPEFDKIFFPSIQVDAFITKPVKSSIISTEISSVLQHIPYKDVA